MIMKTQRIILTLAIASFVIASVSYAAPMLSISVDGESAEVPVGFFSSDLEGPKTTIDSWEKTFENGDQVSVSAEFDPDPIISYSVSVTDFGAASTFSFSFGQSIVLPGGANLVDAQIGGAINDSTGNGVSITPTLTDIDGDTFPEIQTSKVGFGTPTITMGVDVGLAESKAGTGGPAVSSYGPYSEPVQPGPAGAFDSMNVTVAFALSGGGDSAAITGFAQIVPVPEPTSLWLVGCSIIGLVFARRRRIS